MKTLPVFAVLAIFAAGGVAYAHPSHTPQTFSQSNQTLGNGADKGGDASMKGETHDAKFFDHDKRSVDHRVERREIERLRRLEAELLRLELRHDDRYEQVRIEKEIRELRLLIAKLEKGSETGGVAITGWDIASDK